MLVLAHAHVVKQVVELALGHGAHAELLEVVRVDARAQRAARHGAAGLERSQPYTWEAINASMVDTYLRLANARPQAV